MNALRKGEDLLVVCLGTVCDDSFLFSVYWFTGNDPANEKLQLALRLILRGSPGPTA